MTSAGTIRKAKAYHAHVKGAHAHGQNTMVVQMMAAMPEPVNIRLLHKAMNGRGFVIDLVSLRRSITNLTKPDKNGNWLNAWGRQVVTEAYEKPCPITGITVGWYKLVSDQNQLTLFQ
jgi:hypothetical protein